MILPRQGNNAEPTEFIYCRSGPLWISRGVSDHQLEWSSDDPPGVIDFASGQLESGKQVLACFDPARPRQRNESADLDCRFVSHPCWFAYEGATQWIIRGRRARESKKLQDSHGARA